MVRLHLVQIVIELLLTIITSIIPIAMMHLLLLLLLVFLRLRNVTPQILATSVGIAMQQQEAPWGQGPCKNDVDVEAAWLRTPCEDSPEKSLLIYRGLPKGSSVVPFRVAYKHP